MTTNHIDTLKEWWENAEESDDFYPGDTWIKRSQAQTGGYVYDVGRVTSKRRYCEARVLARAPIPKPAWHDAVAVIAHTDYCERQVWERDTTHAIRWDGAAGDGAITSDLRDVTPLIEAKVTDEMVERAVDAYLSGYGSTKEAVRAILRAALGLEAV